VVCEDFEVARGFGRLVVLKVSHSFFQQLGALGGHLITEEGDLGYSEDALRRVDEDPALLKSVEDVASAPQETGR
jgi:hypothetical protein